MKHIYNHIQLGYLGLMPFLGFVGVHLLIGENSPVWLMDAFLVYSISIVSFIAGALWQPGQQSMQRAVVVVLPSILLPLGVFLSVQWALAGLMLTYVYVLLVQMQDENWPEVDKDYKKMRFLVTSVVLATHALMLAFSLDQYAK